MRDPDQLTDTKNIYQVSAGEIFWRNMVAGAGRAVGGILFQIIFFVVIVGLFKAYLLPTLTPLIETLQSAVNQLQQLQTNQIEIEQK